MHTINDLCTELLLSGASCGTTLVVKLCTTLCSIKVFQLNNCMEMNEYSQGKIASKQN